MKKRRISIEIDDVIYERLNDIINYYKLPKRLVIYALINRQYLYIKSLEYSNASKKR